MADKTTATADKTPPVPKTKDDRPRLTHLIVLVDEDNPDLLVDFEFFTGEMAARRARDDRPGWLYLALAPGMTYTEHLAAKS